MKRIIILLLIFIPTQLFPCGSASENIDFYWHYNDIDSKSKFLKNFGCTLPINYVPLDDDPIIAEVIVDAIKNGIDPSIIKNVLKDYNCAYGARRLADYRIIREFISEKDFDIFCDMERLNRTFIVNSSNGVILRNGPGRSDKRLSAIPNGLPVEVIHVIGDWAQVKSSFGEGFVFNSFLVKY